MHIWSLCLWVRVCCGQCVDCVCVSPPPAPRKPPHPSLRPGIPDRVPLQRVAPDPSPGARVGDPPGGGVGWGESASPTPTDWAPPACFPRGGALIDRETPEPSRGQRGAGSTRAESLGVGPAGPSHLPTPRAFSDRVHGSGSPLRPFERSSPAPLPQAQTWELALRPGRLAQR